MTQAERTRIEQLINGSVSLLEDVRCIPSLAPFIRTELCDIQRMLNTATSILKGAK